MRSSRAGVTLIEVLIAVSLLSLLSVGVLWSMRIGFNTMDKTDAHLVHNRRVTNSRKIIESELNGFLTANAALHPRPGEMMLVPFLQAEPNIFRFISNYSLEDAWRGRMQLVTMRVAPGENGQGVRLLLDEVPYTGPEQLGRLITGIENNPENGETRVHFADAGSGGRSFVLADQLAFCRFTYLERVQMPPFQLWREDWVHPAEYPRSVHIAMQPLQPEQAELHVASVSVAIPLTRRVSGRLYRDE